MITTNCKSVLGIHNHRMREPTVLEAWTSAHAAMRVVGKQALPVFVKSGGQPSGLGNPGVCRSATVSASVDRLWRQAAPRLRKTNCAQRHQAAATRQNLRRPRCLPRGPHESMTTTGSADERIRGKTIGTASLEPCKDERSRSSISCRPMNKTWIRTMTPFSSATAACPRQFHLDPRAFRDRLKSFTSSKAAT